MGSFKGHRHVLMRKDSKPRIIMWLYKTLFVISVIFCSKVASGETDDEESTLNLTEKQPPLRAFTAAELSKYDGSSVSSSA